MSRSKKFNRLAVALLFALGSAMPPAVARAGEGAGVAPTTDSAESRPTSNVSAPAESQPNASSATPVAPLLLELQQLKETLEGQSERIAKQTQELESERAALRDELDRIAKLETELHATPNEAEDLPASDPSASPVSAKGSSSVVQLGSFAAAPVVQTQTSPAQGSVDRRLGDLEQRLKKIGPLSFSGDFRLREDALFGGPSDRSLDQNLQNYRLRFNIDIQLSDDLTGGFTLASGNINDPTSTNHLSEKSKPFLWCRLRSILCVLSLLKCTEIAPKSYPVRFQDVACSCNSIGVASPSYQS